MDHRAEQQQEPMDAIPFNRQGVLSKKDVYKWSIPAALVHRGGGGDNAPRSDLFAFGPARSARFCLSLAMDPDKSEYLHNQFGVCLHRVVQHSSSTASALEDIAIKVSFALLDTRDRLHYTCEKVMRDSDRAYATFDTSIFDKHQQIFLRKGLLSIHCALDVDEILSEDTQDDLLLKASAPQQDVSDGSRDLVDDLTSLLDSVKFCDVTLCAGGKEFQAHRSILAARSPVFAAMFEHNTLEKLENRVNIEDVDGEVLHQLLRYVYTGRTDDPTPGVTLSLLAAADKYSLPKLKKVCSGFLCTHLTTDMALGVLTVANMHQDEDLKEAAIQMVLGNAVQVMKTDDWLTFLKDYSELANCVILRLAMHK